MGRVIIAKIFAAHSQANYIIRYFNPKNLLTTLSLGESSKLLSYLKIYNEWT